MQTLVISKVKLELAVAALKTLRRTVFMRIEKTEEDWMDLQSADHAIQELENQIAHEKPTNCVTM